MALTSSDPFGLLAPSYHINPYSSLARLRSEAPVYYCEAMGSYLITRYDDVVACFRDPHFSSDRAGSYVRRLPPARKATLAPLVENLSSWALMKDPPDHTRLRKLMSLGFTQHLMTDLTPAIEALCDQMLDKMEAAGRFDVIADYAFPIPIQVLAKLLGLPVQDAEDLKRWSNAMLAFLGASTLTDDITGRALEATACFETYFNAQIEARRARPGDDLLSALVTAHEERDRLTALELVATCTLLLFAGHETTTNLIGNATWVFLNHPELLRTIRGDIDGRIPPAIEEVLRYEGPVMRQARVVTHQTELHGVRLSEGDRVFLMIASADRDPEHFADPDVFDPDRKGGHHISFGHGRHFCIGAALGRLQGRIAMSRLLQRFPKLALSPGYEPIWLKNHSVRGLERLDAIAGE